MTGPGPDLTPGPGPDPESVIGAPHARTVYLDALPLGSLQRDHIDELTEELSAVSRLLAALALSIAATAAALTTRYGRPVLTSHRGAGRARTRDRPWPRCFRAPVRG
ncbi:hypothetical protein [Streptomyces niveus]|uniref:hypothetical protein n=1 Tax=Streptomyces niveus TaxID=193462 RepID=UPI0003C59876|nr:hypothetical protein [Streptomyces niveus]EST31925.1 hypothetical protein M877_05345 [Streptomyces niveus NCIMB 11891]